MSHAPSLHRINAIFFSFSNYHLYHLAALLSFLPPKKILSPTELNLTKSVHRKTLSISIPTSNFSCPLVERSSILYQECFLEENQSYNQEEAGDALTHVFITSLEVEESPEIRKGAG